MRPEVIVAGDLFVDLILSGFPSWPKPGEESFARHFHREIGGGAAITACRLAALGTPAGVLGAVGQDHAAFVVDRLRAHGVDASRVAIDPNEPTGLSVAISTPEDRSFLTYQGANGRVPDLLRDADFARVRHVHLACAPELSAAESLLRSIRGHGCTISLDAGWHPDWLSDPRALGLLPLIDVFLPNEMEARRMVGDNFCRFIDLGAPRVAVKLGPRGAMLFSAGETFEESPPPVAPVDTVGAGDSFDAGFLHAWLRGQPPLECLRQANACGAASTLAAGGIDGIPCEK